MNAPKIQVIIISVILLVACQTTPSWYWHKDSGSQQDLDQDNYQCLQEAQQQISETYISAYGGTTTENVSVTNVPLFNACMEARGWSKEYKQN